MYIDEVSNKQTNEVGNQWNRLIKYRHIVYQ